MGDKVLLRRVLSSATATTFCVSLLMTVMPLVAEALCSCGSPCDRTLTAGESPASTTTFEACNTINAGDGFEILYPADVTLRAGTSITLTNNFVVGSDAELTIELQANLACDPLVDGDLDGFHACIDCNDEDATRFPGAAEVCNGADDDCNGLADEIGGCPSYVDCPTTLAPPLSGDVCEITASGTAGLIVKGTVLAPNSVFRGGELLVNEEGLITCVGCDCSAAEGAAQAHELSCANGIISPGLINTHDHLTYSNNEPVDHGTERYDHRHEWRKGSPDHTKLVFNSGASALDIGAAELRFLMGGATSTAGAGEFSGLLRNLDRSGASEGLPVLPAELSTFPLDDADGTMLTDCTYSSGRDKAADIVGVDAYVPHMAEGVGPHARNEFLCSTSGVDDLIEPQTTLVHGIAVAPADTAEMRTNLSAISWSPRSNISLYGNTAPVTLSHLSGVPIALGTDWIISGSMNLLRELRCADQLNADYFNNYLTSFELWQTVTTNAARATGVERGLGLLKPNYIADIAIFDGTGKSEYRAILDAGPEDVVLVMRGGEVLYGDSTVVSTAALGGATCEVIAVCGRDKKACVAKDTGSVTLAQLQAAAFSTYPLFSCTSPPDEPSCIPYRPGEYEAGISASDADGDGKDDSVDLCPTVFDPIRPMDGGVQANADSDAFGDACDVCPTDASDSCTPPDPDDVDSDGWKNGIDNCPEESNPGQDDADSDGHGDACDSCPSSNPGITTACVLPVEAIRDPSHPKHPAEGVKVTVEGLFITAQRPGTGYIFAQSGALTAFSGIAVSADFATLSVAPGNQVDITGVYEEYFGLTRLVDAIVTVTDSGTTLPFAPVVIADPSDIATGGSLAEGYESMLLEVEGVSVIDSNPDSPSDYDEFEVTGGLRIDDYLYPALDNTYPVGTSFSSITGVHGYTFSHRKLLPRQAADLQP